VTRRSSPFVQAPRPCPGLMMFGAVILPMGPTSAVFPPARSGP
jgi:hypothetical protein